MQHGPHKHHKKKSARKADRVHPDKRSRSGSQWESSTTGTYETHITDEQLAELEAAQLNILDAPKPQNAVSYWEWREQSKPPQASEAKNTDGTIKRLIKFIVRGADSKR